MRYTINQDQEGFTVKFYLYKILALSSKMITRLKNDPSGILLNDARVTVRATLHTGDVLTINLEYEQKRSDNVVSRNIPLDIIYEDEYYIAINKRPGVPTHPSHDHYDDTVANGLSYIYAERGLPFVCRAVNRLDKDTSGTVIFAKSSDAAHKFSLLQKSKLVSKTYYAIAEGELKSDFSIKGYIRRKNKSVIVRELLQDPLSEDCQFAHTDFKTVETNGEFSLLFCTLHTGRTHQIRVSLSSIGHPILFDELYGSRSLGNRQMLHSFSTSFIHPFTEKQISIISPLPSDFQNELDKKGLKYDYFPN